MCDFCGSPHVIRFFRCRSFTSDSARIGVAYKGDTVALHSIEEWAACETCATLIDAGKLADLLAHVVESQSKGGKLAPQLVKHLRYTYELFFLNRMLEE